MPVEILYLAKNRLEFTKASFECMIKNTNWGLVSKLVVYDDGSTDGTTDYLLEKGKEVPVHSEVLFQNRSFGGPASIMVDYIKSTTTEVFAKLDNDVMVPPEWLDECLAVMNDRRNFLDLLGIEPPASRIPHFSNGPRSPQPEHDPVVMNLVKLTGKSQYTRCDSIGGIGLMRRKVFEQHPDLVQHSIYGGFTEWQLSHRNVMKGWMVPPLNVFLLDRMPIEPWKSLSLDYISKGWQRAWTQYPLDNPFWSWYKK